MKILYINTDRGIPVLGDKGASVHVRAFITAAAALGHEVVLACAALGQGNPPPPARIIHLGVDVNHTAAVQECRNQALPDAEVENAIVRREVERLAHDRALPTRLMTELDRIGFMPDLVYERHALFHRSGVRIAAQLGVPRLLEVNAPLMTEEATFRGLRLIDAARAAEFDSYGGADAIIAVSEAVASHVRSAHAGATNVHVVPNGVNVGLFGEPGNAVDLRRRFGLGQGPVIGFVGSFKPWHGVDRLLDAFEVLAADHPALRVVAVGHGPDLERARARAAEPLFAGRVLLPGRVPHADVPEWMAVMDVTVAPYLPQPDFYFSPMKIVESLAAGRPVVAPRVGQIPDLVRDGETGLLYSPSDASGLAAALRTLIDDPGRRVAMGKAARRSTASRSWTAVVRRILELSPRRPVGQVA